MNKLIRFPSGLRLAVHSMPYTRSVAVGVYVGAGSAYESEDQNGISHFIEHMMFKGTERRSAFDIAEEMESLGVQINAFTSRYITAYYTVSTDEHVEACFDVLSDLLFASTFTDDNIEREKGVVLEEINMCEDDPEDCCYDLLNLAHFGDHPLGRNILGTAERVRSFDRDAIRAYLAEHYTADNIVIVVAGHVTLAAVRSLAERYFEPRVAPKPREVQPLSIPAPCCRLISRYKQIEQCNVAFSFPCSSLEESEARGDYGLSLLNNILGGGMSSRLFQKVREEMGLVYEIYSTFSEYRGTGFFTIYFATNPARAVDAVRAVRSVLVELIENGLSEKEYHKGKEQLKAGLVLGAESASGIMRALGRTVIYYDKTFDLDDRLDRVEHTTREAVNDAIRTIFRFEQASASFVGKDPGVNILDLLKGE